MTWADRSKQGELNYLKKRDAVAMYRGRVKERRGRELEKQNKERKTNERIEGASLVAQWLRIRLPMQGTRVQALVRKDPTCRGPTKPTSHNYWSPCAWSPCSATREAAAMRSPHTTTKSSPRSPQLEKDCTQQWRPNTAKNKKKLLKTNWECFSSTLGNDENSKTIIFKWKQFLSGRDKENSYHSKQN